MDSLTDPESVVEREDVDVREEASVEHQHHFELYEPIEGMAVVGITNDEGEVLLLVHTEGSGAVLPYAPVESGEDWLAVGRRRATELADVDVEIDGIERIRRKYFSPEGDDERETTGYDVVLRASTAADETPDRTDVDDDGQWDARWVDEIPEDAAGGAVLDDIRLFVD